MGEATNRFKAGLNQDINIADYPSDNYYDAMNMQSVSKGDFSLGNIEIEKGMNISFSFLSTIKVFEVASGTTWGGTITFGTDDPIIVASGTSIYNFPSGVTYSVPLSDNDSSQFTPNNSHLYIHQNWAVTQYLNKIVIVSYLGKSITLTPSSGGTLTEVASYGSRPNLRVLGYTNIRDYSILFTTVNTNNSLSPSNTVGQIWKVLFNSDGTVTATNVQLLYEGVLNFSTRYPITAKAFFINDKYVKVYFSDSYNKVRHFNANDPTLFSKQSNQFDLLADVVFVKPQVTQILTGGNYQSGVVQYAYQLYNKYGTETVMSPLSNQIPLTSSTDGYGTSDAFKGDPIEINTGKAIKIKIGSIDTRFEYIKLYAIHSKVDTISPEIKLIADQKILFKTSSSFEFIDDGFNFLGNITLQEFRNYYKNLFGAESIELQNNRLVAAGLNESFFDISFDARAYRHDIAANQGYYWASERLFTANGTTYSVNTYANCENGSYATYKYQYDGATIGGTGPNVSYSFAWLPMELTADNLSVGASKGNQQWSSYSSDFVDNTSYTNYASPINASQMVGYKRGETYRFGIVFIDSKGRRSPAKWIGDIQFPDNTELVGNAYNPYTVVTSQHLTNSADKIPVGYYTTSLGDGTESYWYIDFGIIGSTTSRHDWSITVDGSTRTFTIMTEGYYDIANYMRDVNNWLKSSYAFGGNLLYAIFTEPTVSDPNLSITILVLDKAAHTITAKIMVDTTEYTFTYVAGVSGSTIGSTTTNTHIYNSTDSKPTAKVLYPIFAVKNVPTDEFGNLCSYQIVRAVRTEKDKTRLSQGLLVGARQESYNFYPIFGSGSISSRSSGVQYGDRTILNSVNTLVNFISPEVNFRKLSVRNTDILSITGSIPTTSRYWINDTKSNIFKVYNIIPMTAVDVTIVDSGIIKAETDIESPMLQKVKDYNIYNVVKDNNGDKVGVGGTSMFLATSAISISAGNATDMFIAEIKRTLTDQYGGSSYYDKLNTEYIDCGHFSAGHSGSQNNLVFGGDTYIAYFDFLRCAWRNKLDNRGSTERNEVLYIPVETSINLDYRYDNCFSKLSLIDPTNVKYVQEFAGDYSGIVGSTDPKNPSNYYQEYDLYLENLVYSKPNSLNKYLAKPYELETEETDCMIRVSEEFDYNNMVDQLLNFLPQNFKIVETQYGKINHIMTSTDSILFFQDKAIGVVPISERSVIQDTNGIGLVLGTGDIIGKFKYLSKNSGTRHKSSICETDFGIYYFDSQTKSLNHISKELENVTFTGGLMSYMNTNIADGLLDDNNVLNNYGFLTAYNKNYNTLYFTVLNNSTKWTVSYNENTKSFISFHTYTPSIYILDPYGNLHSEDPSTLGTFYCHNKGDYGKYYGSYANSYITSLVGGKTDKKFANISFNVDIGKTSLSSATNTYRVSDTISKLQFWNSYQTTADLTTVVYPTAPSAEQIQLRNKFANWRTIIPIASTNSPTNDAATRNTRFFDKHLFVKMTYTNSSNNRRCVLSDLTVYYQDAIL